MTLSFFINAVLIVAGALALVVLLMFGSAIIRFTIDTIGAIFRFIANFLLALGWYAIGMLLLAAIGGGWLASVYWLKPGSVKLTRLRPPVCAELVDRNGYVLDYACPFNGVRLWRSLESITPTLRSLVVMLEDDTFFDHTGLDFAQIRNAIEEDFDKKKMSRGASTITQQLAKNLFLTKEKSILRKASEVPLVMRLEKELSKEQILELYLNTIEWGPGIYGIEAASRLYFDHDATSLKEEEAWLLALMIPNPKELNLWIAPKAKKSILKRAQHLATRLHQENRVSRAEAHDSYIRFERFADHWMTRKPHRYRGGRRYPARWRESTAFNITEVPAIKRAMAVAARKNTKVRSHLEREIQERLEALLPQTNERPNDRIVALMDHNAPFIRALIPAGKKLSLEAVNQLANAWNLKVQIFQARSIPDDALWP